MIFTFCSGDVSETGGRDAFRHANSVHASGRQLLDHGPEGNFWNRHGMAQRDAI